jgi:hypothetical protein
MWTVQEFSNATNPGRSGGGADRAAAGHAGVGQPATIAAGQPSVN